MKKIAFILLFIALYYITGCFIYNTFNPLEWGVGTKIAFVFFSFLTIENNL